METFATPLSASELSSCRRLIMGKYEMSEKVTARKGEELLH